MRNDGNEGGPLTRGLQSVRRFVWTILQWWLSVRPVPNDGNDGNEGGGSHRDSIREGICYGQVRHSPARYSVPGRAPY